MAFDRRNPENQFLVPNGRRLEDPRVPRSWYPFVLGTPIQPPPEWPPMRLIRGRKRARTRPELRP
jgi:hypothetical protein